MTFADLGLSDELLRAIEDSGYTVPTPIQASAIPSILMMRDMIGVAQTGTGKTASFVLPMIDILAEGRSRARMPRSLILEPTRELAQQVSENFVKYGKYHKLSMALLIGGVSMGDQMSDLEKGVDVLIATPGRLMDLFGRGKIMLNACSLLVIDEADRMLDMGFIPDIEEICTKLPSPRQTLLFSATMPAPIKKLADRFMTSPKVIEVARPAESNALITQLVVEVSPRGKREALRSLLRAPDFKNAIIFCNRKKDVRELCDVLKRAGFKAGQIQGDMDQSDRIRELDRFKAGDITVLVASDVAARGLDVPGVSHVFNYDVPHHADDYVHRIGRTGRAGRTGTAYTLVTPADAENLVEVEKLIKHKIDRYTGTEVPAARADAEAPAETPAEAESAASETAVPTDTAADRPARGPRRRGRGGKGPKPAADSAAEAAVAAPVETVARPPETRQREDRPQNNQQRDHQPRNDRAQNHQPRDDRQYDNRARDDRGRDDRGRGRNPRNEEPTNETGFGAEGMPAFMQVKARL